MNRPIRSLLVPCLIVLACLSAPLAPARAVEAKADEAELLRQIEAAARLEREHRDAMEANRSKAKREREARQAADEAAEKARQSDAAKLIEDQLAAQEALQADLLLTATGRATSRDETARQAVAAPLDFELDAGFGITDPRIATRAATPRSMPSEIFDRERVEIAAGRFGNPESMRMLKLSLDADGDGKPELIRYLDPKSDALLRQEEDRNYDGVMDAFTQYDDGALVTRVLDGNDDGNPDVFERYAKGRVVDRALDRDDDGVRDVFYRYRGDSLREERHDANNDGVIDLVILYEDRLRVRAEEDADRDGRMDVWTGYATGDGTERVVHVERDRKGRGFADTFDYFELDAGRTVLQRREEDMNGDGAIDVVSFYVSGKLRRRQIANPEIVPL
jgi:hypothetical protein